MRIHRELWAPDDKTPRGPVGTTSGSGGSEFFVTPEESNRAHLKRPVAENTVPTPTENAVGTDATSREGTEAGPDNPSRGMD